MEMMFFCDLITSLSDSFPANNSEAALNILWLPFPVVLRAMQFFSPASLGIRAVENSSFLIVDIR